MIKSENIYHRNGIESSQKMMWDREMHHNQIIPSSGYLEHNEHTDHYQRDWECTANLSTMIEYPWVWILRFFLLLVLLSGHKLLSTVFTHLAGCEHALQCNTDGSDTENRRPFIPQNRRANLDILLTCYNRNRKTETTWPLEYTCYAFMFEHK